MKTIWQFTVEVFNKKVSGKYYTRAEIQYLFKNEFKHSKIRRKESTFWTYKNTLERAGYLKSTEPGLYKKLKKIPSNISESSMKKQLKDLNND